MSMYYLPDTWSVIDQDASAHDPFANVAARSEEHREEHECDTYPSTHDAPLIAAIARAMRAKRILEVGCGLGYSALWLAHGMGKDGHVDTIEKDAGHVALAKSAIESAGAMKWITIHKGRASNVLKELDGPYDLIFADGDIKDFPTDLKHFARLLRPGGVLASANLYLDVEHPYMPGASGLGRYRQQIYDVSSWFTAIIPLTVGLAISIKAH
jgi:predicted O-methyltransferase YrrM